MYARFITSKMKPGDFKLAAKTLDREVIPLLREQRGFMDEVSFFDKDKGEAVAISFWDTKRDLDRYEAEIYPTVAKSMEKTFGAKPKIRMFEVANSTWRDIHPG